MPPSRYQAPLPFLVEQAARNLAELRADPALTAAAYDPLGLSAADLADPLAAALADLEELHGRHAAAANAAALASQALAELASGRGNLWLVRLRLRLRVARLEHPPGTPGVDVRVPRTARADRKEGIVAAFRAILPEVVRARGVLVKSPEDAAWFDEGAVLNAALDAGDREVHAARDLRVRLGREVEEARGRVVAILRRIDVWAQEATVLGADPVPGRSRETLEQWRATRPARVRARREEGEDDGVGAEGGEASVASEGVGETQSGVTHL